MPGPIKFHLDEHVPPAIADGLRRRGIDVTTTLDAGLSGADDVDHIAFERAQGRVIFTHDDDFLSHHARGVEHNGIAYCHQHVRSIGQILSHLLLVHQVLEPEDMKNRIEYV
jgi:hypothetical protein